MNSRCLKVYRAYSISSNSSNVGNFLWSWIIKDCMYQSSVKEKENCCFVFPSSTKREIRHFHVVVVQRRQRNVQKSMMHVQSCYFANVNLLFFCRSRCHRRRRCLSSLISPKCWAFSQAIFPVVLRAIPYLQNFVREFKKRRFRAMHVKWKPGLFLFNMRWDYHTAVSKDDFPKKNLGKANTEECK